jgi:hypothetical protein
LYVEYVLDFHKPTIQSGFVGTADLYTFPPGLGGVVPYSYTQAAGVGNIGILTQTATDLLPLLRDKRSNAGSRTNSIPGVNLGKLVIPDGLWSFQLVFDWSCPGTAAITTCNVRFVATPIFSVAASADRFLYDPTNLSSMATPDISVLPVKQSLLLQNQVAVTTNATFNIGSTILVPGGTAMVVDVVLTVIGLGTYTITPREVRLASNWPNASHAAQLSATTATSAMSTRIAALERKLVVDTSLPATGYYPPSEGKTQARLSTGSEDAGFDYIDHPAPPYQALVSRVLGSPGYVRAPSTR